MNAVPASRFLAEFSSNRDVKILSASSSVRAEADKAEAIRVQALKETYERGLTEGRAEIQAKWDADIARLNDAHAAARAAWADAESAKFGADLSQGLSDIEDHIAEVVARILAPFLEAGIRNTAVDALRSTVRGLWNNDNGLYITGSAPADLLDRLNDTAAAAEMRAADLTAGDTEIRLKIGDMIVETRMAVWLDEVRGAAS